MKVAVIIPCHNVEEHVAVAVNSALAQTHADLEIVAVDDGSTDGTRVVLEKLAAQDRGRLMVIGQANQGACAARNTGVSVSSGKWIQFLDADDRLLPDKIARQVALASLNSQVVAGAYRNLFEDGRKPGEVFPLEGDPWDALVRTRMGTTSANLFEREALLAAGGWDAHLDSSQDYELLFRMLKNGANVVWDHEVGCEVLKRAKGSISRSDERSNWLRYLDLRCAIRDHVRTLGTAHAPTVAVAEQYLFMAIRVLSKHDRQAAFEAFDRLLPRGFVPERGAATTAAYLSAFGLLGFRNAERLAGMIGGTKRK